MVRRVCTATRRLRRRASTAAVLFEYRSYGPVMGDSVGQVHYQRLWERAHELGISDVDRVRRLVDTLPSDWS